MIFDLLKAGFTLQQTMLLEDQTGQVMPSVREAQLQAIIDSGDLWSPGRGQE